MTLHSHGKINPFGSFPLGFLLNLKPANGPSDFQDFWLTAYDEALFKRPRAKLIYTGRSRGNWKIYDLYFRSIGGVIIGGWCLIPQHGQPKRGFVVGHGYGGRQEPDFHLPFEDSVLLFPCFRGLSRSLAPPISQDPYWHVLHDIHLKDKYVLRGCVQDVWVSVSVLLNLFPNLAGKIGYLGISFGGGIGALALSQDKRISKAHFNVPTFGDHRLRLRWPTHGSGESVQQFFRKSPKTLLRTLRYFDAATAAEAFKVPVHFALALRDPVVTPPGQFSIYNNTVSKKQLFILDAGHDSYPTQVQQEQSLIESLSLFFSDMSL